MDFSQHLRQEESSIYASQSRSGTTDPFLAERAEWAQLQRNQYGDVAIGGSAQVQLGDVIIHNYNQAGVRKNAYESLLASLTFEQMDARLRNVEPALPSTCQWIFTHKHFLAWADVNAVGRHQPFLWIKGKPGSGKSTIMKEILAWSKSAWSRESLILAYFFNARSADQLEKSRLGLYRALLYQILNSCPNTRATFVETFASKVSESGHVAPWTLPELQNFHTELIQKCCLPPLVILIDALDEGNEDDVRQLVHHLGRLQQHAEAAPHLIRVVLSSRHYPNITVDRSLSLTVENVLEHTKDIDLYIQSELAYLAGPQFDNLKTQICHRSAGVFLWVVLVVPSIRKAYDKGKSYDDLVSKVQELPIDLYELFSQVLSRDPDDFDRCLDLLAWVLFSLQPLSPTELYCAIEHTSSPATVGKRFTLSEGGVAKYLLECSRGLVEMTEGHYPVVQFIHETVRDYLLRETTHYQASIALQPLPSPLLLPSQCHMSIAKACLQYLYNIRCMHPSVDEMASLYPFSDYAANHWWRHARLSGKECDTQLVHLASEFLMNEDSISRWVQACGVLHRTGPDILVCNGEGTGEWLPYEEFCRAQPGERAILAATNNAEKDTVPPLYFAASVGIPELIHHYSDQIASVTTACEAHGHPLTVASHDGHQEIVDILLDHGADVNAQGGIYANALQAASCRGHLEIVRFLLDKGADVDAIGGQHRTALRGAVSACEEEIVRLLLKHGATTDDPNEYYSPLQKAATIGYVNIARLLLLYNADIHKRGRFGSALSLAIENDHVKMVRLLLDNGADPNELLRSGGTVLHIARAMRSEVLSQILLDHGADRNVISEADEQAYETAARLSFRNITDTLLNYFPSVSE